MHAAYDAVITAAVTRQHQVPHIVGDLTDTEIGKTQGRSITCQLTIATLLLAKGVSRFKFAEAPVDETPLLSCCREVPRTAALQRDSTKAEATSIIRSLLTEIRLIPQDGVLAIELVGALAGLLSLGGPRNDESHPRVASTTLLVAGVGFEPTTFRL